MLESLAGGVGPARGGFAREGVLPGAGEEAEAWGQQTRLRQSPALFLPPRSLGAAWARGERDRKSVV